MKNSDRAARVRESREPAPRMGLLEQKVLLEEQEAASSMPQIGVVLFGLREKPHCRRVSYLIHIKAVPRQKKFSIPTTIAALYYNPRTLSCGSADPLRETKYPRSF
jgi:hypothetical protein